jgi:hypothetical protein
MLAQEPLRISEPVQPLSLEPPHTMCRLPGDHGMHLAWLPQRRRYRPCIFRLYRQVPQLGLEQTTCREQEANRRPLTVRVLFSCSTILFELGVPLEMGP